MKIKKAKQMFGFFFERETGLEPATVSLEG